MENLPQTIDNPGSYKCHIAGTFGTFMYDSLGKYDDFYFFSPDETSSNRMTQVYDTDNRVAVYQPDGSGKIPAPKLVVSFNDDVASGSPASKVNGGNPFEMVFGKGKFVVTGHEFVDLLGCYPVQLKLHAILPKGSMYMPRDMGVGLDIIMRVSTDGTINVCGGE